MSLNELPVVKDVAMSLQKLYGDRLYKIILYGSYARGEQNNESDIDFLILLKDNNFSPYKEIDFYSNTVSHLSEKYGRNISIKAVGKDFLETSNSAFAKFVSRDGISIN
jgi:predicted nucleotidyltransferase